MVKKAKPVSKNGKQSKCNSKEKESAPKPTPATEPFTLVLYESDGQKGVIETLSLPAKDRFREAKCMAPLPLDYEDPSDKSLHPATVKEFGANVDFLYEIPLRVDGTAEVESEPNNVTLAAKKKKLADKEANVRKSVNNNEIDKRIQELQKLADVEDQENTNVDDPIEQENVELGTPNCESAVGHIAQIDSSTCPLHKLLSEATASNLQFLAGCTPENFLFLSKVASAALQHKPNASCASSARVPMMMPPAPATQSKKSKQRLVLADLECSKNDENKWPLAMGIPVYILKHDYQTLPPMEGMMTKSDERLIRTAVSKRRMCNLLLELIVEEQIRSENTSSTLPKEIGQSICAYINKRFAEVNRETISTINTWITDKCRGSKRDRNTEEIRRQEKIINGIPLKRQKLVQKENKNPENTEQWHDVSANEIILPDGTQTLAYVMV